MPCQSDKYGTSGAIVIFRLVEEIHNVAANGSVILLWHLMLLLLEIRK